MLSPSALVLLAAGTASAWTAGAGTLATGTHACTRKAATGSTPAQHCAPFACAALPRTSRSAVIRGGAVSMGWDERTYIMIKPDGVQRGLVGEITKRFEQRGYKLQALKLFQARASCRCSLQPSANPNPDPNPTPTPTPTPDPNQADEALLKAHYADLVEKPFFPSLLAYMMSGPVTCMVWEGTNAVKVGRMMLGETNPQVRSTHCGSTSYGSTYTAQLAMSHGYAPLTDPLTRASQTAHFLKHRPMDAA
jgi:nucleoside diphosphate kinase